MITASEYNAFIHSESERFGFCLRAADPEASVPTCPGWNTMDLLWHLTEVQRFWTAIVSGRLESPDSVFAERRDGPDEGEDLHSLFAISTKELIAALEGAEDDTKVWTWAADQSVGFVRRRQAHEALIHRRDAESIVNNFGPMSPALATDGIDEILHHMLGGQASTDFVPDGSVCRITTSDTAVSWDLAMGTRLDKDGFVASIEAETTTPDVVITAAAADLDTWLWGRTDSRYFDIIGDDTISARLEALVSQIDNE